ncbi:MAG: Rieske 2Fe-2S domain-containing protein [Acidobacteriota bacterium]
MESNLTREPKEAFSRRRWIDALLGTSFVAWTLAVVYPVLKYLTPLKDGGGANKVTLSDAQKQELATNGFLIARLGTDRVLILKDKDKIKAMSAKCTHEGCTVQFLPADGIVWCACHNGKFAMDGRVISGPPPRPLAAFSVEGDLKGAVTISRGGAA